jgi:hypothetical protein
MPPGGGGLGRVGREGGGQGPDAMTQPNVLPDSSWADGEAEAEFWPVSWVASFDHEQLLAASQLLARALAELAPAVEVGVVVQVGGGQPARTWVAVRSDGTCDGTGLVWALFRSLLPWLGCERSAAVSEIPRVSPTVGLSFTLRGDGGTVGPVPLRSQLLDVLGRSAERWQLTVGTGMAVPGRPGDGEDADGPVARFDTSVSLIGTGSEARLASTLLALDVSTPEDPVEVIAREAQGEALARLEGYATAGVAPPSGFLDPVRAGRLLSIPMRLTADRPRLPHRPAPPEDTECLFRDSVPPHVLVVGGTGQGKTTLLHHAAMDAARSGRSTVVVLSPHNDLVARLATSMYRESLDYRVLHFGADDPLRWNIMQPDPGVSAGAWAVWLAGIVKRLFPDMPPDYFGPVWERMIRIVLEILIADPAGPRPITAMPECFARQSDLRDQALTRIGDQSLTRSVREELVPFLNARDPGNAAVWLLSKIEGLVANPAVARVVGAPHTEVDLAPTLRGAHTIVSAPVTQLGDDGARLLGSILIDHLWRQAQLTPPVRPVELFIDEWHRLATPAVREILAEGRKFGLRLRLANQNASQVNPALWDTTLANIGALISFRTGPRDAALLDPMFPTIRPQVITQLPRHWVAVTTGVEDHVGTTSPPLSEDEDPAALQFGHQQARRTASATAAERGVQLAFTYPPAPPAPPQLSFLDEWLEKRRQRTAQQDADDDGPAPVAGLADGEEDEDDEGWADESDECDGWAAGGPDPAEPPEDPNYDWGEGAEEPFSDGTWEP